MKRLFPEANLVTITQGVGSGGDRNTSSSLVANHLLEVRCHSPFPTARLVSATVESMKRKLNIELH